MRKQRLAGIEKEIGRILSEAIFLEVKNPNVKGHVSITNVRVTEDLKFADVYFSILPSIDGKEVSKEDILEGLNGLRGFFRKKVAEQMDIRFIPEIRVKLDDSIEHAIKITKLLNELKG